MGLAGIADIQLADLVGGLEKFVVVEEVEEDSCKEQP